MKLCTYNVHGWADADGRSNTERVRDLLKSLDCDVVMLNEVLTNTGQLARIADELSLYRGIAAAGGMLGNALISKTPLIEQEFVTLTAGYGEVRSGMVASVATDDLHVTVCATHLDHRHEDDRLKQLKKLLKELSAREGDAIVLAGDFNALRLTDYDREALNGVRAVRAKNHWEAPRDDVIEHMDRAGWIDAFRLARAGSLERYDATLGDALAPEGLASCWIGTRIDYFWLPRTSLSRVKVTRCERIESDASDHYPVVLEITAA